MIFVELIQFNKNFLGHENYDSREKKLRKSFNEQMNRIALQRTLIDRKFITLT